MRRLSLPLPARPPRYAYDADSLLQLDAEHPELTNVVWNAHPYMGAPQAGVTAKNADGFAALVAQLKARERDG